MTEQISLGSDRHEMTDEEKTLWNSLKPGSIIVVKNEDVKSTQRVTEFDDDGEEYTYDEVLAREKRDTLRLIMDWPTGEENVSVTAVRVVKNDDGSYEIQAGESYSTLSSADTEIAPVTEPDADGVTLRISHEEYMKMVEVSVRNAFKIDQNQIPQNIQDSIDREIDGLTALYDGSHDSDE